MHSAIPRRDNKSCPPTNLAEENLPDVGPALGDEREEAERFAAVVIDISARRLAKAAKRTTEAAKGWKEGRSLPSTWSMLNMARKIPKVRDYMLHKLGSGAHMQFNSPQGMNALVEAVQMIATMPGPDGDALRALLQGRRDV